MTIRRTIIAAACAVASLGTAHAGELKQIQPRDIDLGEVSGIAYYTVERDGFHLVATLAHGEAGTPVRVQAVLLSGQSVLLSTPRAAGLAPVVVKISRQGDSLLVQKPATDQQSMRLDK